MPAKKKAKKRHAKKADERDKQLASLIKQLDAANMMIASLRRQIATLDAARLDATSAMITSLHRQIATLDAARFGAEHTISQVNMLDNLFKHTPRKQGG